MVKFVKAFLFVLASLVMGACLIFVPDSSGAVSVTYVSVLGIFLGFDVADTVLKTAQMSKGEYKPIHKHKYVISAICLTALIIVCGVVKDKADVSAAMTSLITSVMIVIGLLIGGLEGNKIATNIEGGTK